MNALSVILGLLPGFVWLFFFLQEDPDGEPSSLIGSTFVIGAAFAFFTLIVQIILNEGFHLFNIFPLSPIGIVVLAFTEEIFKFAAAYTAVHRSKAFDVPTDAMVYTIVAALGFATVENLGALVPSATTMDPLFMGNIFQTAALRFVGATLLHALASGLVGYYWALSILKLKGRWLLVVGILLATLLHAIFNYLILIAGDFMYPILFVFVVGFFILNDFDKLNSDHVNIVG